MKFLKATCLICSISVVITLIYTFQMSPVTGYEPHIFANIKFLYYLIILSFATAVVSIVYSVRCTNYRYMYHIIIFIILLLFIISFLPYLRGYAFYGRGAVDDLGIIGRGRTIIQQGHFPAENWYPFTHIWIAVFEKLNLAVEISSRLYALMFNILFLIFIYLFIREIQSDKRLGLLGIAASTPLLLGQFHTTIQPTIRSFMYLVLVIYLIERYRKWNRKYTSILLILAISGGIIFHPTFGLFLTLIVGCLLLSSAIIYFRQKNIIIPRSKIFFLSLIPILWSSYLLFGEFVRFERRLNQLVQNLLVERQEGVADRRFEAATEPELLDLSIRFAELYGALFIYSMVALVLCGILLVNLRNHKLRFNVAYFLSNFGLSIIVSIIFLFTSGIIAGNFHRATRYYIFFLIILFAYLLYNFMDDSNIAANRSKIIVIILTILIITSFGLSLNQGFLTNPHMTQTEKSGMEWNVEYNDKDLDVVAFEMSDKSLEYIYGRQESPSLFSQGEIIQPHLGYGDVNHLAQAYAQTQFYLIIKDHDLFHYLAYPSYQWESRIIYQQDDLERLNQDPTVNKIFTSGGYDTWISGEYYV